MRTRGAAFNPKRRLSPPPETPDEIARLRDLARLASYGGNPEHKKNPGDFGLTPPSSPRRDKTLCDEVRIFSRNLATRLLREALCRGLVSTRMVNGWPQNVWMVTEEGEPLEGQLENYTQGVYHGYPLPGNDPLRAEILRVWYEYGQRDCD